MVELTAEGFSAMEAQILMVCADPNCDTTDSFRIQSILRSRYKIPEDQLPSEQAIARLRRMPKAQGAIARLFQSVYALHLLDIHKAMVATATDRSNPRNVQAARLIYEKEGLLDQKDRRTGVSGGDPMTQLGERIAELKKQGLLSIQAVTGKVTIREAREITIDGDGEAPATVVENSSEPKPVRKSVGRLLPRAVDDLDDGEDTE